MPKPLSAAGPSALAIAEHHIRAAATTSILETALRELYREHPAIRRNITFLTVYDLLFTTLHCARPQLSTDRLCEFEEMFQRAAGGRSTDANDAATDGSLPSHIAEAVKQLYGVELSKSRQNRPPTAELT